MAGDNWVFWFNLTNLVLGLTTILALLIVFVAVGWDLLLRQQRPQHSLRSADLKTFGAELQSMLHANPHSLSIPELGLTMADGGEKIAPRQSRKEKKEK